MKIEVTTIEQKTVIPASPSRVYEAYTDAKKHRAFTDSKTTGKAVVGGKFTAWDGYIFGKYLELQKDKRIVQEWMTTDWPEGYPSSKLVLTLREVPEGTEIVMVHSSVPVEQAEEIAEGWVEFYWNPLKAYFKKQSKA